MKPSGEYTTKDIIPMLTEFDIQSDAGIETAAVVFRGKVFNYFERIEFVSANVQSIYNKSGEQLQMQELSAGDFKAIGEFMDGLEKEFESKSDDWVIRLKEDHEEFHSEHFKKDK